MPHPTPPPAGIPTFRGPAVGGTAEFDNHAAQPDTGASGYMLATSPAAPHDAGHIHDTGAVAGSARPATASGHGEVDWALIASLPAPARSEFRLLYSYARQIAGQRRLLGLCKAIASEVQLPWQTVYRRFRQYSATGDWRALLDKRHAVALWERAESIGLPKAFVEYLREQAERNQRTSGAAIRKILRQWQRWYAGDQTARIPGYDTCPPPAPGTYPPRPAGWSEKNLYRHLSSKFELTAARIGRCAAAAHRPLVFTTRRHLWPASHYLFDDLWHDNFVNILDTQRTGRPLEFHALDLWSACKIGWGFFLRSEDEVTGKMDALTESGMRFLLAAVLMRHGYHASRGTTLVVEHGTAAIRDDLERLLHDISGGKITVQRAGIQGDPAVVGQYAGRPKGNFRFKAALESLGNLIHNELADIPGQTGLSVASRPEEIHGMLRYNDALLNALIALPPERAARLKFPILEFSDWQSIASEIYQLINHRTDHQLEGWAAHTTPVQFRAQDGQPEIRLRRLSPAEVWAPARKQLTRLQTHQIALILYRDFLAITRRVRTHQFIFEAREISPDPLRYVATELTDGEKYDVILNPFAPELLWVFDARGRFIRTCERLDIPGREDIEAVQRAMGRAAHIEATLLRHVARRGRRLALERIRLARENAAALSDPAAAPPPIVPIKDEDLDAENGGTKITWETLPTECGPEHQDTPPPPTNPLDELD